MEINEDGFTLVEMVIVLGCLSLMLTIVNTVSSKMFDGYEQKAFLNQLQKDIYYAQAFAIENRTYVTFRFMTNQNDYTAYNYSNSHILTSTQKPESIRFKAVGNIVVSFTSAGNIEVPGTINLVDRNGKIIYKLVFQLGRGRFYIAEV